MAQQKKSVPQNYSDITFINYDLTAEQKTEVKGWKPAFEQVFSLFEGMIADGFKVSFKFDTRNKCVQCSLTEPFESAKKVTRCMVSRGPDLYSAIRVAVWKHTVLFEGDWANIPDETNGGDVWG